jgi:acyl carrier protein
VTDIYRVLAEIIAQEIEAPQIALDSNTLLEDIAGWDSIVFAGVLVAIETRFRTVATRQQIDNIRTAGDLAALCAGSEG